MCKRNGEEIGEMEGRKEGQRERVDEKLVKGKRNGGEKRGMEGMMIGRTKVRIGGGMRER